MLRKCLIITANLLFVFCFSFSSLAQENALNFDGASDIVSIPHSSSLRPGSQITIEFWMNTASISGNPTLYKKEDGNDRHLIFFEGGANFLTWGLGTSSGYAELDQTVDLTDYENQWVHIAAVYDGTDKILYRNGNEIGRQATTGTLVTSGSAPALLGSGYNGQMDELRVWDYACSSTEIIGDLNTAITSFYVIQILNYLIFK